MLNPTSNQSEKSDETVDLARKAFVCRDPADLASVLRKSRQAWRKEAKTRQQVAKRLKANCRATGLDFRGITPSDGSCFFHAISDQLIFRGQPPQTAFNLRQELVNFMAKNPTFQGTDGVIDLSQRVQGDWETYLLDMRNTSTYADETAVVAMANMLGHDILVITSYPATSGAEERDNFIWVCGRANFDEEPLMIGHVYELHYQSLEPVRRSALDNLQKELEEMGEADRARIMEKIGTMGNRSQAEALHSPDDTLLERIVTIQRSILLAKQRMGLENQGEMATFLYHLQEQEQNLIEQVSRENRLTQNEKESLRKQLKQLSGASQEVSKDADDFSIEQNVDAKLHNIRRNIKMTRQTIADGILQCNADKPKYRGIYEHDYNELQKELQKTQQEEAELVKAQQQQEGDYLLYEKQLKQQIDEWAGYIQQKLKTQPRKSYQKYSVRDVIQRHADMTRNDPRNLREQVQPGPWESENDLISVQIVDFYGRFRMISDMVDDECTEQLCTRIYPSIRSQLETVEIMLNEDTVFPLLKVQAFPPNFIEIAKTMLTNLCEVIVHLYKQHLRKIGSSLPDVAHIALHFYVFVKTLQLVNDRDLEPLIDALKQ